MLGAKQQNKRETRRSMQQAAWIVLEGGFAARPCTVLDLSTSGAKIRTDDSSAVHTKLQLAFSRDGRKGQACEVVWRRGVTMGLKFSR
jgi:hypothetical protein